MRKFFIRLGLGHERGGRGDARVDPQKPAQGRELEKQSGPKMSSVDGVKTEQERLPETTRPQRTLEIDEKATAANQIVIDARHTAAQPLANSNTGKSEDKRRVHSLAERYEESTSPQAPSQLQIASHAKPVGESAQPGQKQTAANATSPHARSPSDSWGRQRLSPTSVKIHLRNEPREGDVKKTPLLPETEAARSNDAMLPAVLGAGTTARDKAVAEPSNASDEIRSSPVASPSRREPLSQLHSIPPKTVAFAPSPSKSKVALSGQKPFPVAAKDAGENTQPSTARPSTADAPIPSKGRTHFHEVGLASTMQNVGRDSQTSLHAGRPLSDGSKGLADKSQRSLLVEAAYHRSSMQGNAKRSMDATGRARPSTSAVSVASYSQSHDSPNRVTVGTGQRSMSPASIEGPPRLTLGGSSSQSTSRTTLASRFGASGSIHQGWSAAGARGVGAPSWSEMTQEELVANIGARERTRQEVLWEIVASEERYVQELDKARELYLDALLGKQDKPAEVPVSPRSHALALLEGNHITPARPAADTSQQAGRHTPSEGQNDNRASSPSGLPIASRYGSGITQQMDETRAPRMSTDVSALRDLTSVHSNRSRPLSPKSPVQGLTLVESRASTGDQSLHIVSPTKSEAHTEGARTSTSAASRWTISPLGRHTKKDGALTPVKKDKGASNVPMLPAPLAQVLSALDNGMIEGHASLSEALRHRYEEQWPLVRSLADVFNRFAYVLDFYREYVIHLERALDALDEAQLMERAMRGKRLRKDRITPVVALGRNVAQLEAAAAEQGECNLSIFLSMPFQRLLKYPMLFQNLLFHTDASTYEFESTVRMVVDVEQLVRLIEDEKVSKEERDKTIDAFARIENIKDKRLLRPRKDRLLLEERPLYADVPQRAHSETDQWEEQHPPATAMSTPIGGGVPAARTSAQGKRSYRRLSEMLGSNTAEKRPGNEDAGVSKPDGKTPSLGSKRDLWSLRFTDVEIRCQRVGLTALPVVSSASYGGSSEQRQSYDDWLHRGDKEDELRIKDDFKRTRESKERQRALRHHTLRSKTRNLYKFISVTRWRETSEKPASTTNMAMDEVVEDVDGEEEDSNDESSSSDSDDGMLDAEPYIRQNKLSFSYLGNDRIEPRLPSAPHQQQLPAQSTRSLVTSRQTGLYTLDKTASSTNVAGAQRDARMSPPGKRFSHNPPGTSSPLANTSANPGDTSHVSSKVSRAVAATSNSRADKFGTRLRQEHAASPRRATGNEDNSSQPTVATTAQESARRRGGPQKAPLKPIIKHESNERKDQSTSAAALDVQGTSMGSATLLMPGNPERQPMRFPSFVRERSMDSNLRLMGTLVQSAQTPGTIPNDEADQSVSIY